MAFHGLLHRGFQDVTFGHVTLPHSPSPNRAVLKLFQGLLTFPFTSSENWHQKLLLSWVRRNTENDILVAEARAVWASPPMTDRLFSERATSYDWRWETLPQDCCFSRSAISPILTLEDTPNRETWLAAPFLCLLPDFLLLQRQRYVSGIWVTKSGFTLLYFLLYSQLLKFSLLPKRQLSSKSTESQHEPSFLHWARSGTRCTLPECSKYLGALWIHTLKCAKAESIKELAQCNLIEYTAWLEHVNKELPIVQTSASSLSTS